MRIVPFGLVGAVAGAVHYFTATGLVAAFGSDPLLANAGGYLLALWVSYFGQSKFTFRESPHGRYKFLRFTLTSLLGFALNSCAYAALLRWTALDYRIALAIVICTVAATTFLLLNVWVFRTLKVAP